MTDRELLEFAAKAAGDKLDWFYPTAGSPEPFVNGLDWTPLTDDGDRYRLASACKLRIDFQEGRVFAGYEIAFAFTPGNVIEEAYAIVRAAAEIGKEMK